MSEKKEWDYGFILSLVVGIIIGISLLSLLLMDEMQNEDEIDHLYQVIQNMQNDKNISSDYVQGWNDCISELVHYRQRAQNVTSNIMNQTT